LLLESLEARHLLAFDVQLVADINTLQSNDASSSPEYFVQFGDVAYFTAETPAAGRELWRSDGTAAGTFMVKDINQGAGSAFSSGRDPFFTNVNGTLFFVADDGTNGFELWKSDGTEAGTELVKVITVRPGVNCEPALLTELNGLLYFRAGAANKDIYGPELGGGPELWVSDGTEAGTKMVKDIAPEGQFGGSQIREITNFNGTLFFPADDGIHGRELWKSDGTEANTVMVKDIWPGNKYSHSGPSDLTPVGGKLFFVARDEEHYRELWVSDGTEANTYLVKDIGNHWGEPWHLTAVGDTLFFYANDGTSGWELWKSDGTETNTVMVKDINPGTGTSTNSSWSSLTNVNGTLFFSANDGTHGFELWKSDGTEANTVRVKDTTGSAPSGLWDLTNVNGTLFFTAYDEAHGHELWKTDGTPANTVLVKDIRPGSDSASPDNLANINGTLFFAADDGIHREELWKSDGTAENTVLVKDIHTATQSSSPWSLAEIGGTVFFSANDGTHGFELWKSDGTPENTGLVKDINAGSGDSYPRYLTNVNGTLFFSANDGTNGYQLWKSDGRPESTVLVKNLSAGGWDSLAELTNVNGTLFFRADDGVHGYELWKSDGTAENTVLVKDILSGDASSYPKHLTNVERHAVLQRRRRHSMVMNSGSPTARPKTPSWSRTSTLGPRASEGWNNSLTNVNGTLFFSANDGIHGHELWKSDGTAENTVLVKDIYAGSNGSSAYYLTNVNGTLFFSADDGIHGQELWKSDGTAENTVLVKDMRLENRGPVPAPGTSPRSAAHCSSPPTTAAARTAGNCGSRTGRKPTPSSSRTSGPAQPVPGPNLSPMWTAPCSSPPTMAFTAANCGRPTAAKRARSWSRTSALAALARLPTTSLPPTARCSSPPTTGSTARELWQVVSLPATSSLVAELANGDLVISDVSPAGADNQLTVQFSDGNMVITDANEQFAALPAEIVSAGGWLSNDDKTLTVPLTLITGTKIIIHGAGGVDTLTADLTTPLGKTLEFHGEDGDDALVLTGANTHTSTYTYVTASDGSVALDPDGPGPLEPWTVTYTGLAAITSDIASDVVELVYTGGDETITIGDAGDGQTTAVSTLGELTTFANPAERLRIVANNGTDTIDVGALATGYASIQIAGDDVTDVVKFNGAITFAADHGLTVSGVGTVSLPNAASNIATSGDGSVSITALRNISLSPGARIATEDGDLQLDANQQFDATPGDFAGIEVQDATIEATGVGPVTVRGRGGNDGTSFEQHGVHLSNGGRIIGGTVGLLSVWGVAGSNGSGVVLYQDALIRSHGAVVDAEGVGAGSSGLGVSLASSSISNVGTDLEASVTVTGTGGVDLVASSITSDGGSVFVEAHGRETGGFGVGVRNGSLIRSEANDTSASVTVIGHGGDASGFGVWVAGGDGTSAISSNAGEVFVEGVAGGAGTESSGNVGVLLEWGALITSTSNNAPVTVKGIGGGGGGTGNHGIAILDIVSMISSSGGNIEVIGTPGQGTDRFGIRLVSGGKVQATTGTPTVTLTADSMDLASASSIEAGANTVILRPETAGTQIDLGGPDSSTALGLTDAELNRIAAGTIQIGDSTSGDLTLSASIVHQTGSDFRLVSGANILFDAGSIDTGGGNLFIAPGSSGSFSPITGGVEIVMGGDATLSFASGTQINSWIDGPIPDTQLRQLNVQGKIDLTGTVLTLGGEYVPTYLERLILVQNDGTDPIIGTFQDLPQGQIININGMDKKLSYVSGNGNDVALIAVADTVCNGIDDDEDGFVDEDYVPILIGTNLTSCVHGVVVLVPQADWGDAPTAAQSDFENSYPTTAAQDGAAHFAIGPSLGPLRDVELDGQPTSGADGDDNNGFPDEDGVKFTTPLSPGSTARVTVNASMPAKLDAWIDFNRSGDWDDPGEQIFASEALTAGDNLLTFQVPAEASLGQTYARFRISTAGGLAPTGVAEDGEVEDYAVALVPAGTISVSPLTRVYDGTPFALSAAIDDGSGGLDPDSDQTRFTFTFYAGSGLTGGIIDAPTDAGNYSVAVSYAGSEHYAPIASASFDLTVTVPSTTTGSGNVTARVSWGTLTITGDNASNSIAVTFDAATGQWIVSGIGGTTVNGEPQEAFAGVSRDVVIRMNGGNDYVLIEDAAIPRRLRVETGAGNNLTVLASVQTGGHAAIRHGSGSWNDVYVFASVVGGNLELTGGVGSDRVHVRDTRVERNLTARLGGGADLMHVHDGYVGRDLDVRLGGGGGHYAWAETDLGGGWALAGDVLGVRNTWVGRDHLVQTNTRAGNAATVWIFSNEDGMEFDDPSEEPLTRIGRDANVQGGAGDDTIGLRGTKIGRDLRLDAGSGTDAIDLVMNSIGRNANTKLSNGSNRVEIDDLNVHTLFALAGGRGDDQVLLGTRSDSGLTAKTARFRMGSGADTLALLRSDLVDLTVNMDAGDDRLYMEETRVTGKTTLRGGRGNDGLTADLLASLFQREFEFGLPDWI
jgi:ELWxxDGT repeat protein